MGKFSFQSHKDIYFLNRIKFIVNRLAKSLCCWEKILMLINPQECHHWKIFFGAQKKRLLCKEICNINCIKEEIEQLNRHTQDDARYWQLKSRINWIFFLRLIDSLLSFLEHLKYFFERKRNNSQPKNVSGGSSVRIFKLFIWRRNWNILKFNVMWLSCHCLMLTS